MIRWQDISQWQPGERRDSPKVHAADTALCLLATGEWQ